MRAGTYRDYCERIGDVVSHIHAHLDDELNVTVLAHHACMSPYHFQRVFARVAGENAVQLVRRLRLERAAWQLQVDTTRVVEIAFEAGFESQEAFARAFRSAFGSPATDFRSANWQSHHILSPNGAHFTPGGVPAFQALSMRHEGVPYEVVDSEPLLVLCRKHLGAPHLVGKAQRELAEDLKRDGFDLWGMPMVTFATNLTPATRVADIETYVAVPAGMVTDLPLEQVELGGGLLLRSKYNGSGSGLGDYWFRVWAEALPSSRKKLRGGPCYQVLRFRPDPHERILMTAELNIPVRP